MQRFRTLTGNGRCLNRQTKTSVTVYRSSSNFPNSGGVGDNAFFFFFLRLFFQKSGKSFEKKRKARKKSGIPPKSGRLTSLIDTYIWVYAHTHAHTHTHTAQAPDHSPIPTGVILCDHLWCHVGCKHWHTHIIVRTHTRTHTHTHMTSAMIFFQDFCLCYHFR